jgi:AcrR family transcriptional regulator
MGTNSKYETREVVKARIIESTLQLLLDQSPADLTLRQIAQHAKCHHPDIATYFGGKLGLYKELLAIVAEVIATRGLPPTFAKPSAELVRLVRLTAWLDEQDPTFFINASERVIRDALTNLPINVAQLLGQRLMALVLTAVLHPGSIGLQEQQFSEHFALEIKIAQLLGKHASA